jgi:transcriptional regulator with XRE-family HTH domain
VEAPQIDKLIAERIRARRLQLGMTLDDLSNKSGVSRAMISRIERGEGSATASLLFRLTNGLGVTLSSLMASAEGGQGAVSRAAAQTSWQDPETGYLRRVISPTVNAREVEITEITLPPHTVVRYDRPNEPYRNQLLILQGTLHLQAGDEEIVLRRGDCLDVLVDRKMQYANRSVKPARYLVVQAAAPPTADN